MPIPDYETLMLPLLQLAADANGQEVPLPAAAQAILPEFAGCFRSRIHLCLRRTLIRGLEGSYLSRLGLKTKDRINIIYADTPFPFEQNFQALSRYTDEVKAAALEALSEEAILIVVLRVYHAA